MSDTNKQDDGGPAFAAFSANSQQPGMSLLEWYAGLAMQGLIVKGNYDPEKQLYMEDLGKDSFATARDMIEQARRVQR